MFIQCKLRKDDESLEVDQTMYRTIIFILFCVTTTRPVIMKVVGLVSSFNLHPRKHIYLLSNEFTYI